MSIRRHKTVEGRNEGQDESDSSSVENLSRRRRAEKRARRKPGVNVAQGVDTSSAQGKERAHPPMLLAKGVGVHAVVHVCGRFLHPIAPLRASDPNNWRAKFYQMVVTGWGREVLKKERAYVLLLQPGSKHDGKDLGRQFFCRSSRLIMSVPRRQCKKTVMFFHLTSDDEDSDVSPYDDDNCNIEEVVCVDTLGIVLYQYTVTCMSIL